MSLSTPPEPRSSGALLLPGIVYNLLMILSDFFQLLGVHLGHHLKKGAEIMKYYHCVNTKCETTFRALNARRCPCCGGTVLRHAMDYEIRDLKESLKAGYLRLPGTSAGSLAG